MRPDEHHPARRDVTNPQHRQGGAFDSAAQDQAPQYPELLAELSTLYASEGRLWRLTEEKRDDFTRQFQRLIDRYTRGKVSLTETLGRLQGWSEFGLDVDSKLRERMAAADDPASEGALIALYFRRGRVWPLLVEVLAQPCQFRNRTWASWQEHLRELDRENIRTLIAGIPFVRPENHKAFAASLLTMADPRLVIESALDTLEARARKYDAPDCSYEDWDQRRAYEDEVANFASITLCLMDQVLPHTLVDFDDVRRMFDALPYFELGDLTCEFMARSFPEQAPAYLVNVIEGYISSPGSRREQLKKRQDAAWALVATLDQGQIAEERALAYQLSIIDTNLRRDKIICMRIAFNLLDKDQFGARGRRGLAEVATRRIASGRTINIAPILGGLAPLVPEEPETERFFVHLFSQRFEPQHMLLRCFQQLDHAKAVRMYNEVTEIPEATSLARTVLAFGPEALIKWLSGRSAPLWQNTAMLLNAALASATEEEKDQLLRNPLSALLEKNSNGEIRQRYRLAMKRLKRARVPQS